MKKLFIYIAMMLPLLTSCVSEDSNYGTDQTYITIGGIEKKYDVTSFAGKHLTIAPSVSSNYADDDLEYTWAYYDPNYCCPLKLFMIKKLGLDSSLGIQPF